MEDEETRPDSRDTPDADRLEEDWERALDTASEAVSAGKRSGSLKPSDVTAEVEQISSERKWLRGFGPTLHKLFPRRGRSEQPPDER